MGFPWVVYGTSGVVSGLLYASPVSCGRVFAGGGRTSGGHGQPGRCSALVMNR